MAPQTEPAAMKVPTPLKLGEHMAGSSGVPVVKFTLLNLVLSTSMPTLSWCVPAPLRKYVVEASSSSRSRCPAWKFVKLTELMPLERSIQPVVRRSPLCGCELRNERTMPPCTFTSHCEERMPSHVPL